MAVRDFPWLADVFPTILNNVDQPDTDALRATYDHPAELVQHSRLETDYILGRIFTLDEGYHFTQDNSITVANGATSTAMPSDCANILEVWELTSASARLKPIPFTDQHKWDLHSAANQSVAFYSPTDNLLIWPAGAPRDMTLEICYERYLPMPIHGIVQDSGATTIQLSSHELLDDDAYNGLNVLIYKGAAAGQSQAATDYAGVSRTLTVGTAWVSGSPFEVPQGIAQSNTSHYTSRPPLPREALNAFIEGVSLRLMGKLQEAVDIKRRPMLMDFLEKMEESLTRKARKRYDVIRNDSGRAFHDPHEEVWAGYIPS